ncbi:transcription-repair coupling factor [Weissella coleopterorum]|uniref:Transcription-repair-coupling factor n=1 Tax=Weissella coleopterorum TaxID=2714949 RepID=A0A6G8AY83_9LACO|nr:transcription-repair coupling factor [Weissella coleopterorum]QIL49912.1 transcription-repair coupling factor [Weissella coleopterorum]
MILSEFLTDNPKYHELVQAIQAGGNHVLTGLTGSARSVYLSGLNQSLKQPMLLVTDSQFHAQQLAEDLIGLLGEERVIYFPAEETLSAQISLASLDTILARVTALERLRNDQQPIIVTGYAGVNQFLPDLGKFERAAIKIDFNQSYQLDQLQASINTMGYHRVDAVQSPGEFSIRGSIIDIYPLNYENPIRMDFFDTDLDSLRTFDVETQKSLEQLTTVQLLPVTDLIADEQDLNQAQLKLELALTQARDHLEGAAKRHLTEAVQPLLTALEQGTVLPEMRQYLAYLYPAQTTILDYLPQQGVVIYDDYPRMLENAKQAQADSMEWWADRLEQNQILPYVEQDVNFEQIIQNDQHANLILSPMGRGVSGLKQNSLTNLVIRPTQQFYNQMPMVQAEVTRWQRQNYTIIFLTNTAERQAKLEQTLTDFKVGVNTVAPDQLVLNRTQLTTLPLHEGFEIPLLKLVVLTEKELFKTITKKAPRRQTLSNAERIKSYNELKVGDFVVHVNHGIGIYEGITTLETKGVKQDYITIQYRGSGKVFIPVSQLDLVQKYVSAGEKAPKLNKLGGTEWVKAKRKVAARVEDMADELLQLYAEREAKRGFAFAEDDAEVQRFEAAFPYPETADQLQATQEIKKDMEKIQPMDRLLVGDVGFGKTEVAFRAAFKAVHEHKQVAMLVPTTILAEQHFESMQVRFDGFDVKIAMLSRFQSAKEVKTIVQALQDHEIDMIVGTHKLLGKSIEFADLGLLIIDEEQRFGVKHKERLKQLKTDVDVLTLTATPIPRTLNMAMVGARDLSVLETPPANRFPIQTYVMEQNGREIAMAIEREMARGGQTFYLHNRVDDIEKTRLYVESLVPDARVAIIHGRMTEVQLEGILFDFIHGDYDVLVTTTIIETGVDIPNANTLVVESADRMGLAQLYQIRGRVGRSNNLAYAYFMYPANRTLTEVSEHRLEAIRDFTELGSGFKIAMRDLSIRGAGDLLGSQQHGFINTVGYDLYTQMLQEAVAAKQGKEKAKVQTDAEINLDVEAYLPEKYVPGGASKIELYQRISRAKVANDLVEIEEDLLDRYGELPMAAHYLLAIAELKRLADLVGVSKIIRDKVRTEIIHVFFTPQANLRQVDWLVALKQGRLRGQAIAMQPAQIDVVIQPKMTQDNWLDGLKIFLEAFNATQEKGAK